MFRDTTLHSPEQLLHALLYLREDILATAAPMIEDWTEDIAPERRTVRESIKNLAHYVVLRRHELRELQDHLRPWGLSSLGRIEAQVLQNLDAVINTLGQISGYDNLLPYRPCLEDFSRGRELLDSESEDVLGEASDKRRVRVMVTMPSHAAEDRDFVHQLVAHGMNIARINCAHDRPDKWLRMIENIRYAEAVCGRRVRIAMDLSGPKVRTRNIVQPEGHRLFVGDEILLCRGCSKDFDPIDYTKHIKVECTIPEALDQVVIGDKVWFDDGKIGAVVASEIPGALILQVTQARNKGDRLKEGKGINFPDSNLSLAALTEKDILDLDFIVQYADIINVSFVQRVTDIKQLQAEIEKRQPDHTIALILKIESALGVRNLPDLLAASIRKQPTGVMIARGDLAVELGFERLAEMQEEILWMCEAAHVPVVWATQVLENLAKNGRPSRSEVTDAAMSERAECVMLNKGEYILRALEILDGILRRMHQHQSKKISRLRALTSW